MVERKLKKISQEDDIPAIQEPHTVRLPSTEVHAFINALSTDTMPSNHDRNMLRFQVMQAFCKAYDFDTIDQLRVHLARHVRAFDEAANKKDAVGVPEEEWQEFTVTPGVYSGCRRFAEEWAEEKRPAKSGDAQVDIAYLSAPDANRIESMLFRMRTPPALAPKALIPDQKEVQA